MIRIKNVWIEENQTSSFLKSTITIDKNTRNLWKIRSAKIDHTSIERYHDTFTDENDNFEMWFSVDNEYKNFLCDDRADAFVVALLYFAMLTENDIYSDIPVTEELMYQINEYIIPSFCNKDSGYKSVKIVADYLKDINKLAMYCGTGVSCGVDSFSSIVLHLGERVTESFRLTHLALFNTGSLNFKGYSKNKSLEEWRKEAVKEFRARAELGQKVSHELGLKFIAVDSNIPDLYQGCFLFSHTFRNLSCVLATQKMWGNYYYSSAGEGILCLPGFTKTGGQYDTLTLPNISLKNLRFYSGGLTLGRIEKTDLISDYEYVRRFLNVCSYETENCGRCSKCIRTLLTLDILGKIDLFREAFKDLCYYKRNKWRFLALVLEAKPSDYFMYELKQYMKNNKMKFKISTYIFHFAKPLRRLYSILRSKKHK